VSRYVALIGVVGAVGGVIVLLLVVLGGMAIHRCRKRAGSGYTVIDINPL
jgi:hypothetical protein